MMGQHQFVPKLFYQFSLDSLVPETHLLRRVAAAVDFSFIRPLCRRYYKALDSVGTPGQAARLVKSYSALNASFHHRKPYRDSSTVNGARARLTSPAPTPDALLFKRAAAEAAPRRPLPTFPPHLPEGNRGEYPSR